MGQSLTKQLMYMITFNLHNDRANIIPILQRNYTCSTLRYRGIKQLTQRSPEFELKLLITVSDLPKT